MPINIGVTGWGDHDILYPDKTQAKDKLSVYSSHFPVVEVDTAFYAIQPQRNYEKWVKRTPEGFSFVIKAFQGMTGHDRHSLTTQEAKDMFKAFYESIQPVIEAGKLNAVLFQFPPWFGVSQQNIARLRKTRELLADLPLALEFRNQTWFEEKFRESTLSFMEQEGWIHSICDEPQAGVGSIPTVLHPTHPDKTLIRFHGRNVHGWNRNGRDNWREVRFLYKYNAEELQEWKGYIQELYKQTKDITILFNNNSGGDAAGNAKQLIHLLDIKYEHLHPRQLDLFHF
ncbi:DUF72 domain-containing protein [Sediminibacillus albus]|uniref:Uncharacterized conserved protein YecE, DUF72 family n=1 Tax=Sediminibacillus albus TaxID=407036 RepID=A0A1G8VQM6_9BACI|nr:DUF72 domain-containing protein [Sediminibacillus albus]SDJ68346.1 Uncharacterized conserved protein YecE, DUF72 family [Sediminibacillus albus]